MLAVAVSLVLVFLPLVLMKPMLPVACKIWNEYLDTLQGQSWIRRVLGFVKVILIWLLNASLALLCVIGVIGLLLVLSRELR